MTEGAEENNALESAMAKTIVLEATTWITKEAVPIHDRHEHACKYEVPGF